MNRLAYDLVVVNPDNLLVVYAIVTIWSYIVGLIRAHGGQAVMSRSQYLVALTATFAAGQMVWFGLVAGLGWAFAHGLLGLAVLTGLVLSAATGFLSADLSHRRAMDAFGSDKVAWFGWVPLIGLALLLTPPFTEDRSLAKAGTIRTGVAAAATLVLLLTGGLFTNALEDGFADPGYGVSLAEDQSLETLLRYRTVEEVAAIAAARIQPSAQFGPTMLVRAEADGRVLSLFIRTIYDFGARPKAAHDEIARAACEDGGLRALVAQGATIRYLFSGPDGGPRGRVEIGSASCQATAPATTG